MSRTYYGSRSFRKLLCNFRSVKKNSLKRKKILIFSEYYLPGYKSGGGMRTIVNIVSSLNKQYDFFIITNNHDGRSDKTPYKNVKLNDWNIIEGAQVFYLDNKELGFSKLLQLIREIAPDIIYSNSYFSTFNVYLLILNKLGKLKSSYLISPCGELSEGALKVNFLKKQVFLLFAKNLKLHQKITWKVTNSTELKEIERLKVKPNDIYIAPDLVAEVENNCGAGVFEKPEKLKGSVRFVFLSRFSEKKNFKFFVENLMSIKGEISVDLYAPIDVESYWKECQNVIKKLPKNIKVEVKQPVPHSEVHATLFQYHFFAMPTLGENFGHVFLEALSAGCPLLISDRTPWQNLEQKKIGWDLPLENSEIWKNKILKCVEMENDEFIELSENSIKFAGNWYRENDLNSETIKLFDSL